MQGIAYLMRLVNSAVDSSIVCQEFVKLTQEKLSISFIANLDSVHFDKIEVLYQSLNVRNLDYKSLIKNHFSEIKNLTAHLSPIRVIDLRLTNEVTVASISFIPILNGSVINNSLVVVHGETFERSEENLDDLLLLGEIITIYIGKKVSSQNENDLASRRLILNYRQREIAELLCNGYSVVEISNLIGFSIGTVRKDISGIYKSLGVSSMNDARKILCNKKQLLNADCPT